MKLIMLLFSLVPFFGASVLGYGPENYCVDGIRTALDSFLFEGGDPEDYWGNVCTNMLGVTSMWAAAKSYCTQHEIDAGNELLGDYCSEYGLVSLVTYDEVLPTLTDDFINALQVVSYEDIDATVIWKNSVLLSEELYVTGEKTVSVFEMSYTLDSRYGWGVYGFWGIILVVGMANRLVTYIFSSRRASTALDVEGHQASGTTNSKPGYLATAHHWVRANLIIPAAFGSHHQRLFYWCTIPTRMETVIVVAFWILNLLLCCVSYNIFWPNLYYTNAMQAWRYIADRTGIISYANLPILWMFSGRNNVFMWLTGWSFSTFNIFHRHVARIATVQAIVHSICYTALEANYGYLAESWTEHYWYMGGMATVTMSFLLVFSSVWLRQKFYEVFLILHIVLSAVTIAGLYYHTVIFDGAYDPYLWPLVAIWVVDRLARFLRLAYCNLHIRLSNKIVGTKSVAVYDKEANLIRIEVTPGSRTLKARPGQHYFLYQPRAWRTWENHPFTLAGWKAADQAAPSAPHASIPATKLNLALDAKGNNKEIQVAAVNNSTTTSGPSSEGGSISSSHDRSGLESQQPIHKSTSSSRDTLVFFVRPYSSWTCRLRDECVKSPTSSANPRILLEGPYGEYSPTRNFENVIFIVGGSGISGALPYMHEHMEFLSAATAGGGQDRKLRTRTKNVTLIWATKQSAMIRAVCESELKPLVGHAGISTHFYATSRQESPTSVQHDNLEKVNSLDTGVGLGISYGRPNIRKSVLRLIDEVHAAGAAGGSIAILTCGPAAMADEARAAVHTAMKQGNQGVGYFEEAFGW